ncbi:GntR family transcriptional regulator [Amycolatopsis sp. NPDC023774]|uniref:GntR family transcriptional regulator n=1 Tax=Amycolatopsis sp. NPDC023774 TaxID=3155015 RepID=UPI003400142F
MSSWCCRDSISGNASTVSHPTPPFLQLIAVIREAIDAGELQPGDRLPSGAELQARYGLASMTVRSGSCAAKAC